VAQRDHGPRAALVQARVQLEEVPLDALLAGGRHGRVRARESPCLAPAAFHRRFAGAATEVRIEKRFAEWVARDLPLKKILSRRTS
jgi:hypothetical protein